MPPLITTKPIVIPPIGCKWVKGMVGSLPVSSCWVHVIAQPVTNQWIIWGVMVTITYGDLCPSSRWVGMVLRNLSAQEVDIPTKTVIGNVQTAYVVPALEVLEQQVQFPLRRNSQRLVSLVTPILLIRRWPSQPYAPTAGTRHSNPGTCCPQNSQSLGVHQMQETKKLLEEYTDVFAKDNLDLGQTSVVKHKITLK